MVARSLKNKMKPHDPPPRIPDHAFIREVCRLCAGSPLALTSANLSNQPSTLAVEEFEGLFPRLDAVFDGGRDIIWH